MTAIYYPSVKYSDGIDYPLYNNRYNSRKSAQIAIQAILRNNRLAHTEDIQSFEILAIFPEAYKPMQVQFAYKGMDGKFHKTMK